MNNMQLIGVNGFNIEKKEIQMNQDFLNNISTPQLGLYVIFRFNGYEIKIKKTIL